MLFTIFTLYLWLLVDIISYFLYCFDTVFRADEIAYQYDHTDIYCRH